MLACQGGCARTRPTINSLWERVPPVRWPSRESTADAQQQQRVAEPTVAANVALKKETESDSVSSVEARSRSLPNPFGSRPNPVEPRSEELPGRFDISDAWDSNAAGATPAESANSPLDRLNAALTDDVENALPERSVTILEERLRVDSLISQARELLDVGQLDRAREIAVTALEIGESAHLEYAPDEDRPMDLVRRIESQMDAEQVTQESHPESDISAATSHGHEPDSSLATKHPQASDRDGKGTPKSPRAWSNLFRREKKPNTPSADPGTQTSNQATPQQPADPGNSVTSIRSPRQESRNAIVMANRSVSLEPTEETAESNVATVSASEQPYPESDVSTSRSELITEQQSDAPEAETEVLMADTMDREASVPDDDSTTPALTDLENIEISLPSSRSRSVINRQSAPEPTDEAEIDRGSTSLFIYIVFGLCCVLAVACYRRGAT